MFRDSAYNIAALMNAAWDLEDQHTLDTELWQVTAKVTSVGDQGEAPPELEVSTKPLSGAESHMKAFMKE